MAETPQFGELARHLAEAAETVAHGQYLSIALSLLRKLDDDPHGFLLDLVINGIRASPYYNIPVLSALPSRFMAELVLNGSYEVQNQVLEMLQGRYQHSFEELRDERKWLRAFHDELKSLAPSARPMNRHRIESMIARNLSPLFPEAFEAENGTIDELNTWT